MDNAVGEYDRDSKQGLRGIKNLSLAERFVIIGGSAEFDCHILKGVEWFRIKGFQKPTPKEEAKIFVAAARVETSFQRSI